MKIVFIIDNLVVAGAQTHLARLVNGLLKQTVAAKVICLGPVDDAILKILAPRDIVRVDMSSIRKPAFWRGFGQLLTTLKRERPDIVHTYLNTANVFGVVAAKLSGVPVVVSSRRDMGHFRTGRIAKMETFLNCFVNKVVCVSSAVCEHVIRQEKLDPGRAVVLYTGVDVADFCPQPAGVRRTRQVTIGMVATMDREVKGHRHCIQAAQQVLALRQDVKFVLVGDGPLKNSLIDDVTAQRIKDFFEFRGAASAVYRELASFDIFVLPSSSEGFSNAILEAMAMELPVVAQAVEGNLEIVEDGQTGFLTKLGDPADMAAKMLTLVDSAQRRTAMGSAARRRVLENFTVEKMVERYQKFYAEIYSARP